MLYKLQYQQMNTNDTFGTSGTSMACLSPPKFQMCGGCGRGGPFACRLETGPQMLGEWDGFWPSVYLTSPILLDLCNVFDRVDLDLDPYDMLICRKECATHSLGLVNAAAKVQSGRHHEKKNMSQQHSNDFHRP